MMSGRVLIILIFLLIGFSFAENITEKPFIKEHIHHTHEINLTNTAVYQQIENYGAFYNITNIFFTYHFSQKNHIFISMSIALGNGIVSHAQYLGFSVQPTGANLEDYIENINNTGRKHITEVWYHYIDSKLDLVAGIIDSASFIDENEFANDENIQFLNNAFVNNPIAPMPSFNPGIYIKYSQKNIEYKFLYMENKPDKGNFSAFEFVYSKDSINIRPYLYNVFGKEKDSGFGLSVDYTNKDFGYFLRIGIPFYNQNSFFSLGIQQSNLSKYDSLGFALGFLNKDKNIYISEVYYNRDLSNVFSITFDLQYMKEYKEDFISGFRLYISY